MDTIPENLIASNTINNDNDTKKKQFLNKFQDLSSKMTDFQHS